MLLEVILLHKQVWGTIIFAQQNIFSVKKIGGLKDCHPKSVCCKTNELYVPKKTQPYQSGIWFTKKIKENITQVVYKKHKILENQNHFEH